MPRYPTTSTPRRDLLKAIAALPMLGLTGCGGDESPVALVDDVSQLNATRVANIIAPRDATDVVAALHESRGAVSIGGARYSMGGQIVAPASLHLDMRKASSLRWLDVAPRRVRVGAGMRWRELQALIDPHDLSVKVMQSYSNFSIGGSVSVNCHGRYVGAGALVNSVRAIQLVTADAQVLEVSRAQRPELFAAVVGGYGGLGVITEVELDLAENSRIRREAERVALVDYPEWFRRQVLADADAVFHNADLAPPDFDAPLAVTWRRTDQPVTIEDRLVPEDRQYAKERSLIWSAGELPIGESVRDRYMTQPVLREQPVAWRNHEASLDADSLEPRTRRYSTYLLQEYFLPVAGFQPFVRAMARILKANDVNALNVSIRHAPVDTTTLLTWARTEVFCFVVYYKQDAGRDDDAARWTRELIDAALGLGGCYYLPYRRHATHEQFRTAYPDIDAFAAIKASLDPGRRFRSLFWDHYLPN